MARSRKTYKPVVSRCKKRAEMTSGTKIRNLSNYELSRNYEQQVRASQ